MREHSASKASGRARSQKPDGDFWKTTDMEKSTLMRKAPRVSVVMPAYNHCGFVGEAIESVLTQSYSDLELIIVDDGSTDGTDSVIAGFDDSRVCAERQRNRGSSSALNRAVGLARGELVAIINSDDRFHCDRIATLVAEIDAHGYDFLVSDFRLIDANGAIVDDPENAWLAMVEPFRRRSREMAPLAALLYGNYTISTSNFFIRRRLFDEVGPFRRYRYVQDWEFALRAAFQAQERFAFVDRPLFDYRLHGGNTILDAGIRCDSEIVRMYAEVLGRQKPEWRDALARMRYFALDIRRSLGGRNRALDTELEHTKATVREQSDSMAAQEAHYLEQASAMLVAMEGQEAQYLEQAREMLAALEEREAQIRELERVVRGIRAELQQVYASRSWRLTRHLRSGAERARRARARFMSVAAAVWRRIPLSGISRLRIKGAVFRRTDPLFRGTSAYAHWSEQSRYSGRGEQQPAASRQYPAEPEVENIRIPGGVAPDPCVSVVIPVHNKLDYTLACLDSIARVLPAAEIEVLVVDDCSSDQTQVQLSARDDIRYLRNPSKLGFVGSCNRGGAEGRGEFLFFLNNDTLVLKGWLDSLVATFSEHRDVGLVGSKLIYPDGRLQEAGGIIWADGSGWNWGRLADAAAPEYNFVRDADYCSGAALMIRRALFQDLGGFDRRYAPAYYEDTDLAFAVRARGLRVLYQPLSQIVHYEGASAGTDLGSGMKAYQVRNSERFVEKWRDVLKGHGDAESAPPRLSADRGPRARMLVIDACTPTPDQDSGSIDMINYFRILIDFGYRVTFVPESDLLNFGRYTEALQAMGVECLFYPYVDSVNDVLKARGAELDVVMLVRGPIAHRHIDAVRRACPRAKIIFNTVDLHFLRERRRAELETGSPDSTEADEMLRMERYVMDGADTTIVISDVEQKLLKVEAPDVRVRVIPLLREIPGRSGGLAGRAGIVFVGGFRHPPNIDAMRWFCAEIWPLIRSRLPDAELTIIGSHMVPEVQALEGKGIRVSGFVEDLDPVMANARLTVAPLRFGAGQKGKVITSLGYGVPCVITAVAAEGLGLNVNEGAIVADDPDAFAKAVERLYTDDSLWERLSNAGLDRVKREFSVAANRRKFADLFVELGLPA